MAGMPRAMMGCDDAGVRPFRRRPGDPLDAPSLNALPGPRNLTQ